MARQRFIHPEIWEDPDIAKLTPTERLFFIGCFSNADDEGRLLGNPAFLRSAIFKYDDFSLDQVREMRDHVVAACKNLVLYVVEGSEYLAFLKWNAYQKPKYPKPSKHPAPPSPEKGTIQEPSLPENSAKTGEVFPQNSGKLSPNSEKDLPHGLGLGWDGMGRDGNGMGASEPVDPPPSGEKTVRTRDDEIAELTSFIATKFIPGISPFQLESILKWTEEGMEPSVIMWALKRALTENVRKPSYVHGILKNLSMAGITTAEAAEEAEKLYREQKARGQPANQAGQAVEKTRQYLEAFEKTERAPPEKARGYLQSMRQILAGMNLPTRTDPG